MRFWFLYAMNEMPHVFLWLFISIRLATHSYLLLNTFFEIGTQWNILFEPVKYLIFDGRMIERIIHVIVVVLVMFFESLVFILDLNYGARKWFSLNHSLLRYGPWLNLFMSRNVIQVELNKLPTFNQFVDEDSSVALVEFYHFELITSRRLLFKHIQNRQR